MAGGLDGKSILITGAGSGIGRAAAELFAQAAGAEHAADGIVARVRELEKLTTLALLSHALRAVA